MFIQLARNFIFIAIMITIVNCSAKTPIDNKLTGQSGDAGCCLGVGDDGKTVYNVPCSWLWYLDASNGHSQDTDNAIAGPLYGGHTYYAYLCQHQNGSPYIADWCFFETQSECAQLGGSSNCHQFTAPNYQNLDTLIPQDTIHNHGSHCTGTAY